MDNMIEQFTKQLNAVVEDRVARFRKAFQELQDSVAALRLKPEDFPEAQKLGIDTANAQIVMDAAMHQLLPPEIFQFFADYEAARQRDLAAKSNVQTRQRT